MKITAKDILKPALILFVICLVVTALLAGTNLLTKDKIAEQSALEAEQSRKVVLSDADSFEEADGYYIGKANNETVGYVFQTEAKGYGGAVKVMTGISADGQITGIVILEHSETPGLGANAEKASFTDQFKQTAPEKGITLVKNKAPSDGEIEAMTGASITSRAVTNAVNEAITKYNTVKEAHNMAKSLKEEFTKGIIKENPVLRLMLGTCATLAVTTAASNAIGMGLATTFVLVCSNAVISLLKKIIPDKVRIPAYITIVAGFVTIVQLLIKAYVPALNKSLGVFLPLIVVNCIILGRAEMFASKNPVLPSIVDGLGMGVGFTAALLAMGIIRELLGAGTVFGIPILSNFIDPIIIFLLPPGGFFVFGILIAIAGKLSAEGKAPETMGCAACPLAASCSKVQEKCEKEGGKA